VDLCECSSACALCYDTVQRDGIGALPLQRGWHGWLVEWATVGMETGEGKGG